MKKFFFGAAFAGMCIGMGALLGDWLRLRAENATLTDVLMDDDGCDGCCGCCLCDDDDDDCCDDCAGAATCECAAGVNMWPEGAEAPCDGCKDCGEAACEPTDPAE